MKSVLRAIRRHFIKLLKKKIPKQSNFNDWPESFKAACFTLYHEKIAGVNDGRENLEMSEADESIQINKIMQVFLDNDE